MNDQSPNNKEFVDSWYEQVISSCNHHDSDQAYSAWRRWDEMIGLVTPEQQSEIMNFQEQLAYTAFPSFPQDVAASLIEQHLISFLRSPVDIDEMIQNRYLYLGYGFEEDDRQMLREAALKNQEQVGGRSVAEWLGALDRALAGAENPENVMTQFFTQDPTIAGMSRLDQAILRRLFQVYYDFFAFPVVTVYGLAESARKLAELEKAGMKEINLKEFFAPDRTAPAPQDSAFDISQSVPSNRQSSVIPPVDESLPLMQALGKFEKLGGQQVTNSKIVIKGQNDPVRPTIFNWLRAYRDELGVGSHDAVMRGQFLFHSINGKGLSADERDQVGMLLKSLDENMPITIDAGRQEVVFRKQIADTGYQISDKKQSTNALASEGQSREQIQNTKYQIQDTTSLASDGGKQGNISRAVFEMPALGRETRDSRPPMDAFSMSENGDDTSSLELGRVTVPPPSHPVIAPRPPAAPVSQTVVPAPRSISFEPAKIDTFSFGASAVGSESSGGMGQYDLKENSHPTFAPAERSNVGSVSFSTNHVLPAEKEKIKDKRYQIPDKRRQEMPLAPQPLTGRMTASPVSKPVQKAHSASSNRYRITPTGRRDDVAPEDAPSPHVVDLRN